MEQAELARARADAAALAEVEARARGELAAARSAAEAELRGQQAEAGNMPSKQTGDAKCPLAGLDAARQSNGKERG